MACVSTVDGMTTVVSNALKRQKTARSTGLLLVRVEYLVDDLVRSSQKAFRAVDIFLENNVTGPWICVALNQKDLRSQSLPPARGCGNRTNKLSTTCSSAVNQT